jgi:hypothetical protein
MVFRYQQPCSPNIRTCLRLCLVRLLRCRAGRVFFRRDGSTCYRRFGRFVFKDLIAFRFEREFPFFPFRQSRCRFARIVERRFARHRGGCGYGSNREYRHNRR